MVVNDAKMDVGFDKAKAFIARATAFTIGTNWFYRPGDFSTTKR